MNFFSLNIPIMQEVRVFTWIEPCHELPAITLWNQIWQVSGQSYSLITFLTLGQMELSTCTLSMNLVPVWMCLWIPQSTAVLYIAQYTLPLIFLTTLQCLCISRALHFQCSARYVLVLSCSPGFCAWLLTLFPGIHKQFDSQALGSWNPYHTLCRWYPPFQNNYST